MKAFFNKLKLVKNLIMGFGAGIVAGLVGLILAGLAVNMNLIQPAVGALATQEAVGGVLFILCVVLGLYAGLDDEEDE